MSHHNTCYRSEHYDLWFDNGFLLYGMSLILNSLPASYFRKKHVFFTSDNYFAVLQHNYNRRDTLFILLTEGNDLNFLREGANKQVISSQADSLIKISRIWADFFPANTSNQPI